MKQAEEVGLWQCGNVAMWQGNATLEQKLWNLGSSGVTSLLPDALHRLGRPAESQRTQHQCKSGKYKLGEQKPAERGIRSKHEHKNVKVQPGRG